MRFFLRFFCFLLTFLILSCEAKGFDINDPNFADTVEGDWERFGDASEGDVVRIRRHPEQKSATGTLVRVSPHSKLFGYEVGEIKWRFLRVYDKESLVIENLNASMRREEGTGFISERKKSYGQFILKLIDPKTLSLKAMNPQQSRVGNTQKWRLIQPIDDEK